MTERELASAILLTIGVGVELLCCVGLLLMHDAFDRLYYLGPASILGPITIAAAVVVEEWLSQAALKAILIAAALIVVSPLLTHATARAAHVRDFGDLKPHANETKSRKEP